MQELRVVGRAMEASVPTVELMREGEEEEEKEEEGLLLY